MDKYIAVDKENTKLSQYGLTYDHVLDGRKAELDPEKKTNRKEEYVLSETVNVIVGDYADDLLDAYKSNESMAEYIEELESSLSEASVAFEQSQEQVKALMQSQGELSEIENAMATMDQQMEQMASGSQQETLENEELRGELQATYAQLESERVRVDTISNQVEEVMSNLEGYLEEEGIMME